MTTGIRSGLRIDVDTLRGTRAGVPCLCRALAGRNLKATFFFSVGPDNMGRHLWRLLRPAFLAKVLRTSAARLYGWDILLRGTFWPGPLIGRDLAPVIKAAADAGHEVGLHAWDHHAWQARAEHASREWVRRELRRGYDELSRITGAAPACSAAPAWKCTDAVLMEKLAFPFRYNSDCRGECVFTPVVDGTALSQPQVPVTLPTYDEVIGRDGLTDANYNDHIFSLMKPDRLNVLTIHAEVEGDARRDLFAAFLDEAAKRRVSFAPLGELLTDAGALPHCALELRELAGRDGLLAFQGREYVGSGR